MIVEPGFLDHEKTMRLRRAIGDGAVECILRLWAHCQVSRRDVLPNDANFVASICRWRGKPEKLLKALLGGGQTTGRVSAGCAEGFLEVCGENLKVHDWRSVNATLVSRWENGRMGGRPPKTHNSLDTNDPTKPSDGVRLSGDENRNMDSVNGSVMPEKTETKIRLSLSRVEKSREDIPPTPQGEGETERQGGEETEDGRGYPEWAVRVYGMLAEAEKAPGLTVEHVMMVDREFPKALLGEHAEEIASELRAEAGQVRNALRWLRGAVSGLEVRVMMGGLEKEKEASDDGMGSARRQRVRGVI
jgi:hypothetical protein